MAGNRLRLVLGSVSVENREALKEVDLAKPLHRRPRVARSRRNNRRLQARHRLLAHRRLKTWTWTVWDNRGFCRRFQLLTPQRKMS